MRTVYYQNKKGVNANTIYRTTSIEDRRWLLETVQDILDLTVLMKTEPEYTLLTRPNRNLPRQGTGHFNSIESAAQGIIDNMVRGSQRNFSHRTCTLIERLFDEMQKIIPEWEQVRFVDELEIKSQPEARPNTYTDLFDISAYDVEYIVLKRKK